MKNADFSPNCTGQLDIYVLIPDFQGTVWVKLTHVIHIDPIHYLSEEVWYNLLLHLQMKWSVKWTVFNLDTVTCDKWRVHLEDIQYQKSSEPKNGHLKSCLWWGQHMTQSNLGKRWNPLKSLCTQHCNFLFFLPGFMVSTRCCPVMGWLIDPSQYMYIIYIYIFMNILNVYIYVTTIYIYDHICI